MAEPLLPSDYPSFLSSIKERVQQAQLKAIVAVNSELITLYWHIGQDILRRQQEQGWGVGVIEQLSRDLHAAFPQMRGFSPRNLGYMKAFVQAYPDETILQTASAKITWSHNTLILDKVKDPNERIWYVKKTIEQGWSLGILELHIKTGAYHREGKAITNFQATLPALQSDLAENVLKDPYVFNFVTTSDENTERNLQTALVRHIEQFMLELGIGFTFAGSNYRLQVGDNDLYLDLLFYHVKLRRYVVIELKTGAFKAEYIGKMSLYLSAVDELVKEPDDNPTIGLILCTSKDKTFAEYTLRNIQRPVGVATYETTRELPDPLKDQLPDIQMLTESVQRMATQTTMSKIAH